MPLSDKKKVETRDRINRDPDFRDAFLIEARNMYKKAIQFNAELEDEINRFEQILGAEPGTYEFMEGELDEIDIFELILDAFDSQTLEDEKNTILNNIVSQMENEKYFISSTASLSGLAKAVHETPHHVSQVINEKIGQSFFELLATYRVKEAKAILKTDLGKKLTIEDIAERVGYNSKSAFNSAFKKITSKTPSSFRDS